MGDEYVPVHLQSFPFLDLHHFDCQFQLPMRIEDSYPQDMEEMVSDQEGPLLGIGGTLLKPRVKQKNKSFVLPGNN